MNPSALMHCKITASCIGNIHFLGSFSRSGIPGKGKGRPPAGKYPANLPRLLIFLKVHLFLKNSLPSRKKRMPPRVEIAALSGREKYSARNRPNRPASEQRRLITSPRHRHKNVSQSSPWRPSFAKPCNISAVETTRAWAPLSAPDMRRERVRPGRSPR